jgi:hypothetical protein
MRDRSNSLIRDPNLSGNGSANANIIMNFAKPKPLPKIVDKKEKELEKGNKGKFHTGAKYKDLDELERHIFGGDLDTYLDNKDEKLDDPLEDEVSKSVSPGRKIKVTDANAKLVESELKTLRHNQSQLDY